MAKKKPEKKEEEPKLIDHVLTEEDMAKNPELAEKGLKVGDTVQVPEAEEGAEAKKDDQEPEKPEPKPEAPKEEEAKSDEMPLVRSHAHLRLHSDGKQAQLRNTDGANLSPVVSAAEGDSLFDNMRRHVPLPPTPKMNPLAKDAR